MWDIKFFPDLKDHPNSTLNLAECFIYIKPGRWAENFLNSQAGRENKALNQYGFLPNQIMKIDSYHYNLAFRLALFLSIENRINLSGVYYVEKLLKIKYSQVTLNEALKDRQKAYQIRQTWNKSLMRLHQLGWKIQVKDPSYPEQLLPEFLKTSRKSQTTQSGKNLLLQLLTAKIQINQPDPIPSLLRGLKKSSYAITGEQIKQSRLAKGFTQEELADALLISKAMISMIESGKRKVSSSLMHDLQKHLDF